MFFIYLNEQKITFKDLFIQCSVGIQNKKTNKQTITIYHRFKVL